MYYVGLCYIMLASAILEFEPCGQYTHNCTLDQHSPGFAGKCPLHRTEPYCLIGFPLLNPCRLFCLLSRLRLFFASLHVITRMFEKDPSSPSPKHIPSCPVPLFHSWSFFHSFLSWLIAVSVTRLQTFTPPLPGPDSFSPRVNWLSISWVTSTSHLFSSLEPTTLVGTFLL